MKIFIATDHRGISVVKEIVDYLRDKNYEIIESDIPHSDSDDYVDFAFDVAKNVAANPSSRGILICGSGVGMSIAANKIKGIRAARCVDEMDAFHTRCDNDANILCIGYKQNINELLEIIDMFLTTPFSNAERHVRRINKITAYENGE